MSIVIVKPIDVEKWHGKKGEEDFTRTKRNQILVDGQTGKWCTGLTEEEAKKYGDLLGVNLSDDYKPDDLDCFWTSSAGLCELKNTTMTFDTSKPRDFVKVANLRANKFVANSLKELEEGKFPFASHVIFDEEAEVEQKSTKINQHKKCYELTNSMTLDEKYDIVLILANKNIRGRSANLADVEIDNIINDKPLEFIKYATMDRAKTTIHGIILEALLKNILTQEGTSIMYMGNPIATDVEDAVKYFEDPNNQNFKTTILSKILGGRPSNKVVRTEVKPETKVEQLVKQVIKEEVKEPEVVYKEGIDPIKTDEKSSLTEIKVEKKAEVKK